MKIVFLLFLHFFFLLFIIFINFIDFKLVEAQSGGSTCSLLSVSSKDHLGSDP